VLIQSLNGKWQMKRTDEAKWQPAEVPGSVYSDLMAQGRLKDPFYRENDRETFNISCHDFEYEKTFILDKSDLAHDQLLLCCEGLDTLCDAFLNQRKVLSASDMHRTYEVDVHDVLQQGENSLHIVFHSPVQYVLNEQKKFPLVNSNDAVSGISHLRKAHYMFGWDWSPKLPDMGIWRNLSIQAYDTARISDLLILQQHRNSKVELQIKTKAEMFGWKPLFVQADIISPQGKTICSTRAEYGKPIGIDIPNPQLWWPNNLGAHPLYEIVVQLLDGEKCVDSKQKRIGLRTLTVNRQPDEYGESFAFTVNGRSFFAMGADYVPEDNILSRMSRQKTEKLISSCVHANFNMLRVWGGAFYPSDDFYDLCDENGLVVWQDLMFACGVYHMDRQFRENIVAETEDNVRRLRHHACLGLWCGNNELELAWEEWGWSKTCSPRLKAEYIKMFEVLLPEIVQKLDSQTSYWLASPSSGGGFENPNDENRGDMHDWRVWGDGDPFSAYREIYPRFMSEFGIQSFPCMETVASFTEPEDRNLYSPVMEEHQKSCVGNEYIMHYIAQCFRFPKDFDSFIYLSQLVQARGLRCGVEHWRRHRGRCMGAIYWQLNDCWPAVSWASIDYFGRWKALQYAAKRFFAPVLVSAAECGTVVNLFLCNESSASVSGTIYWKLLDSFGTAVHNGAVSAYAAAGTCEQSASLDFTEDLDSIERKRNDYLAFSFQQEGKTVSSGTVLFVEPKHFNFQPPKMEVEIHETDTEFVFAVSSKAFAKSVELKLSGIDAVFSDNYMDIPAGEIVELQIPKSELPPEIRLEELKKRLTCRSLYDTFHE
jgi:beta-mannosidase